MESPTDAVVVEALRKHYGDIAAVDGLSFTIGAGEVFGLLGPNGAGKTTTVEILEGYRRADGGQVRVLGVEPWNERSLRPRIGVMLQEGGLYPGLRPPELLRLFASYYDDPEDPDALLALVGLGDASRTPVRRMSGGQQQRLSLALALIGRPALVFLDEPTAGLDPHGRATTWAIVRSLRERGVTVVLTTHAMDEAEQLCDRVAIVDQGHLVASGSPSELTAQFSSAETTFAAPAALDCRAIAVALGLAAESVREVRAGEYRIAAPATPRLLAALTAWLDERDILLTALSAGQRSLEDVFLDLTNGCRS